MTKGNTEHLKGKRGKKGGTQFPRHSLKHLGQYLKSLASKTHTNTITIEQLNAGVFGLGANSPLGKVKSSALKQFGLVTGDYKKMKATELTSKISMAEGEELKKEYQEAFKKVSVFVNAINTYQNSKTDKSKIGQYAVSTLKVHPDMKDDFVEVLVESAEMSGLCTSDGSAVTFTSLSTPLVADPNPLDDDTSEDETNGVDDDGNSNETPPPDMQKGNHSRKQGQISNINVNIDVDPSMDPEKLEKLLKLLKNYGAI